MRDDVQKSGARFMFIVSSTYILQNIEGKEGGQAVEEDGEA